MAQIATTTQADPLGVPANTRIDRDPRTGYLYALVKSTTANTWDLYKSTNSGTTWTLHLSLLRSNVQEMGSTFIANDGHLYLSYRTNESAQDRIWFRRCRLDNPVWGPETLTGQPAHGGTPGAIHQGMDIQLVQTSRWMYVVIVVGTTFGSTSGITLYGVLVDHPAGTHKYDNTFLRGRRQWMDITGTHRIVPSVDIEHDGSGKVSDTPHLWISYGRDVLRMVKLSWTGAGWSGPSTTQLLQSGLAAQDGIVARWDGQRWLTVVPHPTATDTVLVVERDRGNTTSTLRQTPAHPAGVVRTVGLSYSRTIGRTATAATRVYAVGTSNADLHFVDFVRETGLWTSWTTVTATDVLGTPPAQFSIRRGSVGYARHDLAIGHAGSPNIVTSYHQTVTYAPDTPTWDVTAIGVNNGAAAEVASPLVLDWTFTDPDPADAQSAWALSRQIGGGALAYFRASDSTWQAAEVKNVGATTALTLASGWGLTSDAPHGYKVKVWDGSDTASLYSDAFVVIPSGKVNPTITAPTAAQVLAQDRVAVSWTVAEQTAFRVRLLILAEVVFDSGWVAGTVSTYTPDFALGDGFGYTVSLQTRNLEGLVSDEQTRNFTVDFIEPATATLVATPLPSLGVIRVAITNPPPSPTLNANPFFETDAAGWTGLGGTVARSTAQAHEGVASLLLTPDGVTATVEARSENVSATVGATYRSSAWVWCAVSRKVRVHINWRNSSDTIITGVSSEVDVTAGTWTLLQVSGTAPALTAKAQLAVTMASTPLSSHLLHIDEAELRLATDVPSVASVALYRRPIASPILVEHDFETADMSGWGTPNGGTAARSNTRAHRGSWSYQLTANGTDPLGAHVETVKLPCTPNAVYFLDMWIAGSSTSKETFAQIRWFNAAGAQVGVDNGLKKPAPAVNAWDFRWCRATAPSDATQMTLHAVIGLPASGDTIWVDEVRVRVNDPNEGVRVAQGLPSGATYDDWGAVSGVPYEYRAQTRSVIGTTVGGVWTA